MPDTIAWCVLTGFRITNVIVRLAFQCFESVCGFMISILNEYLSREVMTESKTRGSQVVISSSRRGKVSRNFEQNRTASNTGSNLTDKISPRNRKSTMLNERDYSSNGQQQGADYLHTRGISFNGSEILECNLRQAKKVTVIFEFLPVEDEVSNMQFVSSRTTDLTDNSTSRKSTKSDVVYSENSTFRKETSEKLPDDAEQCNECADTESKKCVNEENVDSCKIHTLLEDTELSSEIFDSETMSRTGEQDESNHSKQTRVKEMHDIIKAPDFVGVEVENMQQTSTHDKRDTNDLLEIPLEKDEREKVVPGDHSAKKQLQIKAKEILKQTLVTEIKELKVKKNVKPQISLEDRKQLQICAKDADETVQAQICLEQETEIIKPQILGAAETVQTEILKSKVLKPQISPKEDKAPSSKVLLEKAKKTNEQENVKKNKSKVEKSQALLQEKCASDILSGQTEIEQAQKLPLNDNDSQLISGKGSGKEKIQKLKNENKAEQQNLLPETAEVVQTEFFSPKVCESNQSQSMKVSENKSKNKEYSEGKLKDRHLSAKSFDIEQESEEILQNVLPEKEIIMEKSQILDKESKREQQSTDFDIEFETMPPKYRDHEGKAIYLEKSNMLVGAKETNSPKKESETKLPIFLLEENEGGQAQVPLLKRSETVLPEIDHKNKESENRPISSQKKIEGIEKSETFLSKIITAEECELVEPHTLPSKIKTLQTQINTRDESEVLQQQISGKEGEIIESKIISMDEAKYEGLAPESEIVQSVISFQQKYRTECLVISDVNKEVKLPSNEDITFLTKERENLLAPQQRKIIPPVEESRTVKAAMVEKNTDKLKLDVLYDTDDVTGDRSCDEHEERQMKFPSENESVQKNTLNFDDQKLQKKKQIDTVEPMIEKDLSVAEHQKHEAERVFSTIPGLLHVNARIMESIIESESSALQNFEIDQPLLPKEFVTEENVSSEETFTSQDQKDKTDDVISSGKDSRNLKDDCRSTQKIIRDNSSDASDEETIYSNIYEKGPSITLSDDFLLDPYSSGRPSGERAEHIDFDFSEENRTNTVNKIDIKLYNNFTGSEISANDLASFSVDGKGDRGKVADDYDPLTEVPKYWQKIEIKNCQYVLERREVKCFIRNPDYLKAQTDENTKGGIVKEQSDIVVHSLPKEISDLTENLKSCSNDSIKQSMRPHLVKQHTPKDKRMSDDMDTSSSEELETIPEKHSDHSTDERDIEIVANSPNTDATVRKSVSLQQANTSILSGIKAESKAYTEESIIRDKRQTGVRTPEKLSSAAPANQSAKLECGNTPKQTDTSSYEEIDYVGKSHERLYGDVLVPNGPFMPITSEFLLNPYHDPSRRCDIKPETKKLQFEEEYSVDKWNRSDEIFYYNVMGCDVPEGASSIPCSKECIGEIENFYDPAIQMPDTCDGMCIINNDYVLGKRVIKAYNKDPGTYGERELMEKTLSEDNQKTVRSKLKVVKVPAHSPPKRTRPVVISDTCPVIEHDDSDQKAEDPDPVDESKQESRNSPEVSNPNTSWYDLTVAAERIQEMLKASDAAGSSELPSTD